MSYKNTIKACFVGYIVQAIVNNFITLMFLAFASKYEISLSKITLLVTINFGLQFIIDLLSTKFIDKIGYRVTALLAHIFVVVGFISLTILPEILKDAYTGIVISVMIYALGGGLLEVIISPMVEACPTDNKERTMSLLHSFYCWGHVGVVLISTIFFQVAGMNNWKYLCLFFALIPVANAIAFLKVPIAPLLAKGEKGLTLKELVQKKIFWLMMILMLCAGACEQSISQWASSFAEKGLGVDKTIGDLAGPMMFAILMGISRIYYGKLGHKIHLHKFMLFSGFLCIISYLMISLSPLPLLSLLGCGICGFSVGILWPGTFSMSASYIKGGGTAMFALLALAGDLGCQSGPTFVGIVSYIFLDNLKYGIFVALIFPIILIVILLSKTIRNYKNIKNSY